MEKWRILVLLYAAVHNTVASSALPSPVNVFFSSVNLRNVLHWDHGNGTPSGTLFTVQYAIYGDSVEGSRGKRVHWRAVQQCKDVQRNWCDLTNETWDLEQGYYAKVRAVNNRESSRWTITQRRFDPSHDTTFGPPTVSVVMEGNNAIVHLKGPMKYRPERQAPEISMATIYHEMTYMLSVHNTRRNKMSNLPVTGSSYKYGMMEYDTEYCFSAKTRFQSMSFTCQASAWNCFTTPQDPVIGQMQRVIVGIVVPGMCAIILTVTGYFLCRSLKGIGQKRPHTLDELTQLHLMPQMFSPEYIRPLEAYLLMPCSHVLPEMLNYASQKPGSLPPGHDAAQENEFAKHEAEFAEHEVVDYGCVIARVTPSGVGEDGEAEGGAGERWRESRGARALWGGGSVHPAGVPTAPINSYLPQQTESQSPGLGSVYPPDGEAWSEGEREGLEGAMGAEERGEAPGAFLNGCPDSGLLLQATPTSYACQSGAFGFTSTAEDEGNDAGGIRLLNWVPGASTLAYPPPGYRRWESAGREEATPAPPPQSELSLDSVFVRQASEEEREAQGETGCEADTLLTHWDLVVAMDQ